MATQIQTTRFKKGIYRYSLDKFIAKKIYSVSGFYHNHSKTFTQNSDYILENNQIVWSSLSSRSIPDENTNFVVIYEYDPIPETIEYTDEQLGRDIQIVQQTNGISSSPNGDLSQIGLRNNFLQAIRHRLLTNKGELYDHPNYGSDLYKLLGQPMTDTTIELARLYVVEAVNQDPRVDKILDIKITPNRLQNMLKIEIKLTTIVSHEPLNIVYDFYLEKEGYIYM